MKSLIPTSRWCSLAAAAALLISCHGQLKKAESLIANDKLLEAEQILAGEFRDHPTDNETRFLLGRVYLLEMRADDAGAVLSPLAAVDKFAPRVAQAYHEAALRVPSETPELMARYASASAQLDPAMKTEACRILTTHLDMRSPYLKKTGQAAAALDDSCKRQAMKVMLGWIQKADPLVAPLDDLEHVGLTASEIDPGASLDFAHALRDLGTAAKTDHRRAAELVAAAKRIDPAVASELETVVLMSEVTEAPAYSPRPTAGDELLNRYSGSPLEVTKRVLKELGAGLDAYAAEHGAYPRASQTDALRYLLRPYLRSADVMLSDGWGGQIEYVWTYTGVRLVSGGADGHVDAESRIIGSPAHGVVDEYGTDVIWEGGSIVQQPTEAALHKYDRK